MTGLVLGGLFAAAAGTLAGGIGVYLLCRTRLCPEPEAHQLTEADHEAITSEFAAHTTALQRQVSEYADVLADGDPLLRDRLRLFESGGGRP